MEGVRIAGSTNQRKVTQLKESGFNVNVINLNALGNMSIDINQVLKSTSGVVIREPGGMGSNFTFQINDLAAKIYIDEIPMEQYGNSMPVKRLYFIFYS